MFTSLGNPMTRTDPNMLVVFLLALTQTDPNQHDIYIFFPYLLYYFSTTISSTLGSLMTRFDLNKKLQIFHRFKIDFLNLDMIDLTQIINSFFYGVGLARV